jgi:hypothetical protein
MLLYQLKPRDFITLLGSAAAASINIPAEPKTSGLREGDIGCRPTSVAGLWTVYL